MFVMEPAMRPAKGMATAWVPDEVGTLSCEQQRSMRVSTSSACRHKKENAPSAVLTLRTPLTAGAALDLTSPWTGDRQPPPDACWCRCRNVSILLLAGNPPTDMLRACWYFCPRRGGRPGSCGTLGVLDVCVIGEDTKDRRHAPRPSAVLTVCALLEPGCPSTMCACTCACCLKKSDLRLLELHVLHT